MLLTKSRHDQLIPHSGIPSLMLEHDRARFVTIKEYLALHILAQLYGSQILLTLLFLGLVDVRRVSGGQSHPVMYPPANSHCSRCNVSYL
jgi:hypothetical protein